MVRLHRYLIKPGMRVLEWGCGKGELLRAMDPSEGLGIDSNSMAVEDARAMDNQNKCEYRALDIEKDVLNEKYDHIIINYLLGYLGDIQKSLENIGKSAHSRTRLHITSLNTLWLPIIRLGKKLNLISPQPNNNWLSQSDIIGILELAGWETVHASTEQLFPFDIPVLNWFFNAFLVKLPFLNRLGLTIFITARLPQNLSLEYKGIKTSVIVPVRNEAGHIAQALERIPKLGDATEVIFVEGNSSDDTWDVLEQMCKNYKGELEVRYMKQPGSGKWDAVSFGFGQATGDILVIQDGDLTAPPEDLPKFHEALVSGKVEFVNGCRLVYPMEDEAMRFLNLLGNKFFAALNTYIIGQYCKDSLCGTKMILKRDYQKLLEFIKPLKDADPFGDFNLLFGSAMMRLKILDLPVRYRKREYGDTNISRFYHGTLLLRMTWLGLRVIKFKG
ncbi:MAG: bifunctional class I SAM-dependent methyltransferase/glycosyltransferase family 2 protein [Opitutales bacterium]